MKLKQKMPLIGRLRDWQSHLCSTGVSCMQQNNNNKLTEKMSTMLPMANLLHDELFSITKLIQRSYAKISEEVALQS